MTYTVGTLFSGIGVPDLACALLGMDILFQVEIDDFCRKVLAKHAPTYWPNAAQFTDVRSVGSGNLPSVDILIGGFPCQDVSFAGSRRGMGEGTRSGLWSEFQRIIAEIQPRCIVIENVPGVLAPVKARRRCVTTNPATRVIRQAFRNRVIAPPPAFQVITQLRQMGYVVSSGVISAADVGAQHKRERWWCVAYRENGGINRGQWIETDDAERSNAGQSSGIRSNGGFEIKTVGVGHANGERMEGNGAAEQRIIRTRLEAGLLESAGVMGNPKRNRCTTGRSIRQGRYLLHRAKWEDTQANENGQQGRARVGALRGHGNTRKEARHNATTQSRMGRNADGLTRGVDFVRPVSTPNEPQFDYEPPRVVKAGLPNRANRIKALGNAWDFRNAYALMYWVKDFLDNEVTN